MAIATVNPATGQTVKTFAELTDEEVERCLARASVTFGTYRRTTFAQRSAWMRRAGRSSTPRSTPSPR